MCTGCQSSNQLLLALMFFWTKQGFIYRTLHSNVSNFTEAAMIILYVLMKRSFLKVYENIFGFSLNQNQDEKGPLYCILLLLTLISNVQRVSFNGGSKTSRAFFIILLALLCACFLVSKFCKTLWSLLLDFLRIFVQMRTHSL